MAVNKKKVRIERTALVFSSLVIASGLWFWTLQVLDVLETLALAYG